jgi:aspartate/methionine/tyrosine aminotransferase
MKLAERMSRIGTESAFDVLVRARALEAQGKDIIHLEIGEPDFPTPQHIVDAGKKALDEGWTHYGPSQGLPELREAIAEYISATRGISVSPANVCVTPGGKPIIFFPMLALLGPGDEVIYPNPGFPIYESMIRVSGATAVPVPLVEERGFSFDLKVFRQSLTARTKMVVLNSPHNPTGGMIPAEDIAAIADEVRGRDIVVLSDEIYSRIVYGNEKPVSIASLPGMLEKTIILDGFSKTYAMTGWRIGYTAGPLPLIKAMAKIQGQSTSNPAHIAQIATIAALTGPQDCVETMRLAFDERRLEMVKLLRAIPNVTCREPKGAFYAFPDVSHYVGMTSPEGSILVDDVQLCDWLVEVGKVAVVPGSGFGAPGHVRLSYACSMANIRDGIGRLATALATLH